MAKAWRTISALPSTQLGLITISPGSSGYGVWLPGCSLDAMEDSKRGVLRGLLQYVDKAESESGATGENTVDQVGFFFSCFVEALEVVQGFIAGSGS